MVEPKTNEGQRNRQLGRAALLGCAEARSNSSVDEESGDPEVLVLAREPPGSQMVVNKWPFWQRTTTLVPTPYPRSLITTPKPAVGASLSLRRRLYACCVASVCQRGERGEHNRPRDDNAPADCSPAVAVDGDAAGLDQPIGGQVLTYVM